MKTEREKERDRATMTHDRDFRRTECDRADSCLLSRIETLRVNRSSIVWSLRVLLLQNKKFLEHTGRLQGFMNC